jgi:hypothetical protein
MPCPSLLPYLPCLNRAFRNYGVQCRWESNATHCLPKIKPIKQLHLIFRQLFNITGVMFILSYRYIIDSITNLFNKILALSSKYWIVSQKTIGGL